MKQSRHERDILSKAAAWFAQKQRDVAKVFEFMTANQAECSVQMMLRTLGVSRSGFYAYHSRPPKGWNLKAYNHPSNRGNSTALLEGLKADFVLADSLPATCR